MESALSSALTSALSSAQSSESRDPFFPPQRTSKEGPSSWDCPLSGDNFLTQSTLIKREEQRASEGNKNRVIETHEGGATALPEDGKRKEWAPGKLNALEAVRQILKNWRASEDFNTHTKF